MKQKGIIITGTSGSGKSTIVEKIINDYPIFRQAKAITTRNSRPDDDDHYIYLDEANFDIFEKQGYLITETKYRGKKYGITCFELNWIESNGFIPILIISPDSVQNIYDRDDYLSFFIDADDNQLDERLRKRDNVTNNEEMKKQREIDRFYSDIPNYIIKNNSIEDVVELIYQLWEYRGIGGLLHEKLIRLMISCGMLIKDAELNKVKGASYDLTLGDEYYYAGEIRSLEKGNLFLKIEPYDYAIVSCKEQMQLPKDIVANFGLTVGLFCQGIILSNGEQVDPGFRGTLFCLLFNTSNKVVSIRKSSHYATIEFNKMLDFSDSYNGKYQGKTSIIEYIPPNVMQGAINELKQEIEELRRESRNMQTLYIGVIAIIVAAISVLLIVR